MSVPRSVRIALLALLVALAAFLAVRDRTFAEAVASGAAIALLAGALFIQGRYQRRIAQLNSRLESELAELTMANRIVENSSTVIFRMNPGPRPLTVTYVSRNVERYGYSPEQLMREPALWLEAFHPDDRGPMIADVKAIMEGYQGPIFREMRFQKADGGWAWFKGELCGVRDEDGELTAFEGLFFDITQIKLDEERIAHISRHDPLTGLANRTAFVEQLEAAFAAARAGGPAFAVLYLDLDHFKDVNDAFGHEQGDSLLATVADRLRRSIRAADTAGRFSVARLGGDEFAVLQTAVTEPSDAASLAERLLKTMAEPLDLDDASVDVSASIGISLYRPDLAQASDLLTQADLALYRAKEDGRNQFRFHSRDLDVAVRERVAIASDLRAALRNGQLELYYQPQVDGPSGRIIGVEALMRWNRGPRGPVSPDVFIPIAERSGLISALGEFAIKQACAQMARWREIGVAPPLMGINISALQLKDSADLLRVLGAAMIQAELAPDSVELELTESVLAEGKETSGEALKALRNMGARIAIDDFGTGYSSLQYLSAYPISRIKIAQQFIRTMIASEDNAAIVRATIGLARALQLDLIAEGVETAEQLAFLTAHGCNAVQGYYFARPAPADEITKLLKQGGFDQAGDQEARRSLAVQSIGG